jgi:hypothetical protein
MRSPGSALSVAACNSGIDEAVITRGAPTSTVSLSTLGPPLAVVAVARTVFAPGFSVAVAVCQVSHEPVPGKAGPATAGAPLTVMSIGRFVVVPLANRNASVAVPAAGAVTVHST